MSTELTTKNEDTAVAAAAPSAAFLAKRKAAQQSQGRSSIRIGVLHLHQGSGKEDMTYGPHPKGTFIDELSMSPVAVGTRLVPVHVEAYQAVWFAYESKKGDGRPLATFRDGEPRPKADESGTPIDYADQDVEIRDHLDLYVLLPGDSIPRLYRAKSTALRSVQSMNTMEVGRVNLGNVPGAYRLGTRQMSNDENQWHVPVFTADGDVTADEMSMLEPAFDLVTSGKFEVVDAQAAPQPADPMNPPADSIPI